MKYNARCGMDEINSGWNVCDDGDELFKFHNNRNFQIS
jgi:hypothetical protein